MDRNRSRKRALAWFARLRADDCAPAERREFDEWHQASETNRREYRTIQTIWDELGEIEVTWDFRPPLSPRRTLLRPLQASGMVALGLLLALVFLISGPEVYRTGDEQRTIELNDGSIVQLNIGTALDTVSGDDVRKSVLREGEAFFSVKHRESPFIVLAGGGEIRDIGTKFLVSKQRDQVEVVVFEGAVAVIPKNGADPITLLEGEAYAFSELEERPVTGTISYRPDQIVLQDTPLHELVFHLNTAFGQSLRLEPEVAFQRVSGVFRIDNFVSVLGTLPKILPVTVVDRPGGKWIRSKS